MKPLVVLFFAGLGVLLFAVGLFGMMGEWTKILFIDLTPLQESWQPVVAVFGAGIVSWFIGGVVMRT